MYGDIINTNDTKLISTKLCFFTIRSTPIPSLLTLMSLSLIMIWLRNLENLLYLTQYVTQIWLGMSILLLVIVKLFKYHIVSNLFKVIINQKPRNLVESDVKQEDTKQRNPTRKCDLNCYENSTAIIRTIYNLSQKQYTFSMPFFIPSIYFIVCLVVLTIPIIYDIYRLLYTLIFVATGIPVYFIFIWPKDFPICVKSINAKIMAIAQKVFLALPDKINQ